MPGSKISYKQIGIYMKCRKEGNTQEVAAAKAGFCERSARNVEKRNFQEAHKERKHRTRKDPFEEVWEVVLKPMLQNDPYLQARTLLEYLQDQYEGQYPESMLRTLQRKVKMWKAEEGPSKDVIFRQNHPPGRQGLSDFTEVNSLKITIKSVLFCHRFYHYRLAYSRWSYIEIVHGGESFSALSKGLQNAFWKSGGVPENHRTDSLSAAYKNCSDKEKERFQTDYSNLCRHYDVKPTRNNKGESHENGSIESAHHKIKSKIDQQLRLRGSRDFDSIEKYQEFVKIVVNKENSRINNRFLEEKKHLKVLPQTRTYDYTEETVQVTITSTIRVKSVIYSVPSRLIGEKIKIRIYDAHLDCYLGMCKILQLTRQRRGHHHTKVIDYRHLIDEILRKPGSFENYIHQEDFFPTDAFRCAWEYLRSKHDIRTACKEYLRILKEASMCDREAIVSKYLELELREKRDINSDAVKGIFRSKPNSLPSFEIDSGNLYDYAQFLGGYPI